MGLPDRRSPPPAPVTPPPRRPGLLWSSWTLAIALLTFGPLALPLVWRNPYLSTRTKTVLTAALLGLTLAVSFAMGKAVSDYLKMMEELMG